MKPDLIVGSTSSGTDSKPGFATNWPIATVSPVIRVSPLSFARLHADQIGLIQRVLQHSDGRGVDHDSINADGAEAGSLSLDVFARQAASGIDRVALRREHVERDVNLGGMNRPLADAADDHAELRLFAVLIGVLVIAVWAIDGIDPGGARAKREPEPWIVPDVARIVVVTARTHRHRLARRIVPHAEDGAFEPRVRLADLVDVLQALHLFNQHLDANRFA